MKNILLSTILLFTSLSTFAAGTTVRIGAVGETMAFDKTTFEVKAGSDVTVIFKNVSKTLEHNWVLTEPGKDQTVAMEGIKAGGDKGWFAKTADVIAFTKMIKPGGEEKVSFKAPTKPGSYPYICTFPGHSAMMKGTMIVK